MELNFNHPIITFGKGIGYLVGIPLSVAGVITVLAIDLTIVIIAATVFTALLLVGTSNPFSLFYIVPLSVAFLVLGKKAAPVVIKVSTLVMAFYGVSVVHCAVQMVVNFRRTFECNYA